MSLRQLFTEIEQDEWVNIPQGWLQGRTIYGGLVAGMMMQKALVTIADPAKRLLSTSVTFVGPVQERKARLTAEILRQGKSVTTIEVRLWQDDAVQSILIASFGTQRESSIQVKQERTAPIYPEPQSLAKLPQQAAMPQCYQQFDVCWAEGNYPCTASAKPDFGGWFRFNPTQHANDELTVAELMTLLDIWPPGVLPMFQTLAPASSLTWHVTYVHPVQHQLYDWFKYKVFTDYAAEGYSTEYAHLWDAENRLIAISRQTVTVFA
ncbi:thioesterase family protein [Acinetobacter kyonggiensis]|uniref:Acyl-CoA thioesterase n=1 Tax=Acinetobacter kyonggiensis TaxID=595670 RepID=A0A1H3JGC9_9GAMM|nr:thioesterase family protein [Acinetobacter kyonggiensis]SDY38264.1 Acyl-CoA thioesterase [Acinetobacter kyonggiensis]